MLKFENIVIGFIALVSAIYLYFSAQMDMGTISHPGPGFVPVVLGSIGLIISMILLLKNLIKKDVKGKEKTDKAGAFRAFGYLIMSFAFIPMLQYLGSVITVFVLILALSKISGYEGWWRPLLFAVIFSAGSYLVFNILLQVSLPRGIFY